MFFFRITISSFLASSHPRNTEKSIASRNIHNHLSNIVNFPAFLLLSQSSVVDLKTGKNKIKEVMRESKEK
jgi:hypothetical protein